MACSNITRLLSAKRPNVFALREGGFQYKNIVKDLSQSAVNGEKQMGNISAESVCVK